MTTRAATAAFNLQAKQELVKLLFGQQYYRKDLRTAYLKKVQEIHPDKHHQNQNRLEHQRQFIQLQDAWNRYEELAKVARTINSNNTTRNPNFTLFGVGCSFADSEQERNLRNQFTDQACRGWFSAGALVEQSESGCFEECSAVSSTRDPLFVPDEEESIREDVKNKDDVNDGNQAFERVQKAIRDGVSAAISKIKKSEED